MTNRPRAKGTSAETAVVNWWRAQGERLVDRHALHGSHDVGDINGVPDLVQSVKFVGKGKPMNISGWLNELADMRRNVAARTVRDIAQPTEFDHELPAGVLIIRRSGYPDVGQWYAVMELGDWWNLYRELLT